MPVSVVFWTIIGVGSSGILVLVILWVVVSCFGSTSVVLYRGVTGTVSISEYAREVCFGTVIDFISLFISVVNSLAVDGL